MTLGTRKQTTKPILGTPISPLFVDIFSFMLYGLVEKYAPLLMYPSKFLIL